MKHTKGPWSLKRIGNESTDFHQTVTSESFPALARVHVETETGKANARLIAAAPDMLAVLKELLPYVTKLSQPGERWARLAVEQAIEKAEGK
jgi:hypothetical protein